jgi:hypothetical protein
VPETAHDEARKNVVKIEMKQRESPDAPARDSGDSVGRAEVEGNAIPARILPIDSTRHLAYHEVA